MRMNKGKSQAAKNPGKKPGNQTKNINVTETEIPDNSREISRLASREDDLSASPEDNTNVPPEDDSWRYTGKDSLESSDGDNWRYTGEDALVYEDDNIPPADKNVSNAQTDKNGNRDNTTREFNGEYAIELEGATVRFHLTTEVVSTFKEFVLRKLSRNLKYNEFFPVRDISLKVKPGESWGLIGVNGSGKSTLLKLICQILKPYRGSVKVRGSISPLIELGSGMDNELSGRKNIYLNGCILGHSKKYMEERFDEIAEFSGLGKFLDVPLKNYSSGMRARLGFSVATIVRPEILVVDEVLAVGDMAFQQKCQQRMAELRSGGTTVLFVSHSDRNIRDICDHAIWLDHGRCMMQGEVNEVCDAYLEFLKNPFQYMIGQPVAGA